MTVQIARLCRHADTVVADCRSCEDRDRQPGQERAGRARTGRMTRQLLLTAGFIAAFTTGGFASLHAAAADCTPEQADKADKSIDTPTSWLRVYASYQQFRGCDDGGIAEGYSDRIVDLLVSQWNTTPKLVELSRKNPGFERFVFGHVDSLMSPGQGSVILRNAQESCPSGAVAFCHRLISQVRSAY